MNFETEERRYKVFSLSRKQLLELITGDIQIINMPEWSTILEIEPDFRTRGWIMLVHHPSFPEVPEGQRPDELILELQRLSYDKRKLTFK